MKILKYVIHFIPEILRNLTKDYEKIQSGNRHENLYNTKIVQNIRMY